MDNCIIYDFETLGDQYTGVAVSLAILKFNESNFTSDKYSYESLVSNAGFIKFNVEEQVKKYNRRIDKKTLEWWQEKDPEAIKQLKPLPTDKSITELWQFIVDYTKGMDDIKKVYTRGNSFDPVIMEQLLYSCGRGIPYPWYALRDTRSMLDGLLWGSGIDNKFIPEGLAEKFIHHDPRHDIAMDVMRLQTVVNYL